MNAPLQILTDVSTGGFRWTVPPHLLPHLFSGTGLRLQEWIQSGQARIIKQGPHRIVYRVELPDHSFYVKHNLIHDRRAWFRQLVRPSKARVEYDVALAAAARGVPTISPLAMAEQETRVGSGESILITRSLEDTTPLHYFLAAVLPTYPEPRAALLRQRLAQELGTLVAKIHDAGVLHHDLHAGNLLVRVVEDDRLQLFVIDLLAVQMGPPLDWPTSRHNLMMINCWFTLRVNRADRLRFWKAYFLARGIGEWTRAPDGARLYTRELHEIERLSWQRNLRFWQRRDRRCLFDGRYYQRIKGPGVVGHAVTELAAEDVARLCRDPDAPFAQPGVRLLKESASSTVIEMQFPINGTMRPVIYKRFRVTSCKDPAASLFRPPPALRSWVQGQGFRERGLPTARPFLVLHRRQFGLLQEGYLLTEKIDHAGDLHAALAEVLALPDPQRTRQMRLLTERVARTIRALHQRQLSHRDLKGANILARFLGAPPGESSAYSQDIQNLLYMPESSIWLIDLVGVESYEKLPRLRKIQNLTRLNASFHAKPGVTRTDRLRFLLVYLQCGAFGRCDWKSWWKQIERATWKKVLRNSRLGKPLH